MTENINNQTKNKQPPTLRKYLDKYRELKRSKSSDVIIQSTKKQKSPYQLEKLVIEKLCRIQNIIADKGQFSKTDSQILQCVNQVQKYCGEMFKKLKCIDGQQNMKNAQGQSYKIDKSPRISYKNIRNTNNAEKKLLSPIQINKNFDSITISASNAGTKQNIYGEDSIMRFGKFGSIAENSGKSLSRMDIGTSIKISQNTYQQPTVELKFPNKR